MLNFWVRRSMMMASTTKAKPDTKPEPILARCKAERTLRPNPGAPIIEAITTIDKDSITVWLMPAMIVAFANGNSTLNNLCAPVLPNDSAASTSSVETCLIPRFVKRTVGGIAKISDASTPGTIPIPKKATAGIR